jgi:quinoprotein glucose dehydrogenase
LDRETSGPVRNSPDVAAAHRHTNNGGSVVTAGGLIFIAASTDDPVRAIDIETGRTVWQAKLPAGGQATPMTYLGADGRQYLLVVAGGHGSTGTKPGDYVIAYALPKK